MPDQIKARPFPTLRMILLGSVVAVPVIASVVGATSLPDNLLALQDQWSASKDITRFAQASRDTDRLVPGFLRKTDHIAQLAPPRPGGMSGPPAMPPMDQAGNPLPPFGPGSMMRGRMAPKAACLDDIHREASLHGYLKSKLHITEVQKAAWKRVEDAAEPAIEKMRAICQMLPSEVVQPPSMAERAEFFEKHISARLDFLRAVKAPMQELLAQLTPDQRMALDTPPVMPPF